MKSWADTRVKAVGVSRRVFQCELAFEFKSEVRQFPCIAAAPNKVFEYVRYAHRTASQLRRAAAAQLRR